MGRAARGKGNAKRSADLAPLEVVAGATVAIGDGAERARDQLRGQVALYVGGMGARGKNFYNDVAVSYGYADAARQIQDLYLDGKRDEAAAAIPEELLEQLTFAAQPATSVTAWPRGKRPASPSST